MLKETYDKLMEFMSWMEIYEERNGEITMRDADLALQNTIATPEDIDDTDYQIHKKSGKLPERNR